MLFRSLKGDEGRIDVGLSTGTGRLIVSVRLSRMDLLVGSDLKVRLVK